MKNRKQWELLHEDDYFLIINKSAGLLTLPDRFDKSLPCLLIELQQFYPDIFPVHRLDQYTSGVIIFAKEADAYRSLSQEFEQRKIQKNYIAIVQGIPIYESGMIDIPIAKIHGKNKVYISSSEGKPSITNFQVIENFKMFGLIKARPETGRLHQIRVYLQYLGTPLLVDSVYGGRDAFYLSEIKKKYTVGKGKAERPLISRQTLHASTLSFEHPYSKQMVTFEAPLPKDMRATIAQIRRSFGDRRQML